MKPRPIITQTFYTVFASVLLASSASAASIGVKFLDASDTAWSAGTSVGAPGFAQTNWNFMQTDWSGNGENSATFATGLIDSNGQTVSGAGGGLLLDISYDETFSALHYDSSNTWSSGSGNTTANHTLMNGYLDDHFDDQPYVNLSLDSIEGLYETYTIVIYLNGDSPTQTTGRYWLESWTDPLAAGTVITNQVGIGAVGTNFSGTFIQAGGTTYGETATPVNVDASAGNYIVFSNITARNIRIRGAGGGDPEAFGRAPINGFQIIDTTIPEPSVALLGGLSLLGLLRRRR